MKLLDEAEQEIAGRWVLKDGRVVADGSAMRIAWLTSDVLERLAADETGWLILFRDPSDMRLWELSYPQSEMHGGGPPSLRCISVEQARKRYSF